MKDKITLKGIKGYGYHGVFDYEQRQGQVFFVDVILKTDTSLASHKDELADAINYADVITCVVKRLEGTPVKLIETLAAEIAQLLIQKFFPTSVEVTLHKPHAPVDAVFEDVALTIHRSAPTTVLAFGSNLGDRKSHILAAIAHLDHHPSLQLQRVSPMVESVPVGGPEQPLYINAVAEYLTLFTPEQLLEYCHEVENHHGRVRDVHWGPRTLDIDIITFEKVTQNTSDLVLPHPQAHKRAFVLYPWHLMDEHAMVAPGQPVAALLPDALKKDQPKVYLPKVQPS